MDEKEYIERDHIVKFIETGLNDPDKVKAFGHDAVEILAEIHLAPAADVAPVVHARWITEDNTEGYRGDPHCAACKYILLDEAVYGCTPGVDDYFYCPNCGAKMDGRRLHHDDD